MNKKLLAASVAAAVAAPAAMAEAVIYGKFHTSLDKADYETRNSDTWKTQSRSSRFGAKGSEDLGGGLKAIYQIEMTLVSDGGNDQNVQSGFGSMRNTFVGLSGDWGTALVGRHDTPAKMAFYATGNERLGDSVIDLNRGGNNPIGVFTEFRANNAIAYVSPNFSGFTVAAAIIPGEQSGNKSTGFTVLTSPIVPPTTLTTTVSVTLPTKIAVAPTSQKNDNDGFADHYSIGLMYSGNGFKAGLGYEKIENVANGSSNNQDDSTFWQAGLSYTFNNFSVGAQYEDHSDYNPTNGIATDDTDYTAWAITGKATFGNNAISLVYTDAETEPDASNSDIEKTGWGISAEHNFSKRTKVYAAYASAETEYDESGRGDEDDDVFSLGIIHNF